ncbi:MAG: HD domain-containing protein [Eubacteriales bacterium]
MAELTQTIHGIKRNENGEYYCRALNTILNFKLDGYRFCGFCPLFYGMKDNPECIYDDFDISKNQIADEIKTSIDKLIDTGLVKEFASVREEVYSPFVAGAFVFAAEKFKGKTRKGTTLPYIVHLMETAYIVSSLTSDDDIIAAAVLHDVIEDTDTSYDEVENQFGKRVAGLVSAESEDKRSALPPESSWKIRKQEALNYLSVASNDVLIIALGDKLSNIRALAYDYSVVGDLLWSRFNSDIDQQSWYYRSLAVVLSPLKETGAWKEYNELVDKVFPPALLNQ